MNGARLDALTVTAFTAEVMAGSTRAMERAVGIIPQQNVSLGHTVTLRGRFRKYRN
jgi:hypothetical protein